MKDREEVVRRLAYYHKNMTDLNFTEEEEEGLRRSVDRYIEEGYTPDQAYRSLKWTEEVNPEVSEEKALAKMREVLIEVLKSGNYKGRCNLREHGVFGEFRGEERLVCRNFWDEQEASDWADEHCRGDKYEIRPL